LIWILLVFLLCALAALTPLGHRQLGNASMLYWLFSWLGQTFALPLALVSAACAVRVMLKPEAGYALQWLALVDGLLFSLAHYRNHRMGRALLAQLAAALKLDETTRRSLVQFRVPALTGLIPGRGRRPDVERLDDIAYGPHGKRNLLDIYRPRQLPAKPMPVLIQIHGGAWVVGDKGGQALPLLYHMAANGWLCFSINYRLGPANRFPAMLTDILHAIAWVKQHATDYGGDPGFVALTGGSAGGHLSALAALVGREPGRHPDFPVMDTSVSAVMPLYGRYDFLDRRGIWGPQGHKLTEFKSKQVMPGAPHEHPELWQLASPVDHLHPDAPPFLIVHGTQDCLISVAEARHFAEELRAAADADVQYAELAGAQHAFDIQMTPLTRYFIEGAQYYLDYQFNLRPGAGSAG
jgi:acetyl esterase/lipase